MLVTEGLLPGGWLLGGNVALAVALMAVALRTPWRRLADNETQHCFLGGCVALAVLWSIHGGVAPGLAFHFSGVTALTLMIGWRLAFVASLPVMAALAYTGAIGWGTMGINALALFALPALVTSIIHGLVQRRLPLNFFVYIFVTAHFGAMLAVAAGIAALSTVYVVAGVYPAAMLAREFFPVVPMVLLSEGFLNGLVMAVLVATRPGCVTSFDDRLYLYRR